MQKVQIPWVQVSSQLATALRASPLPLPELAAQAKVQYHAAYRMKRHGVKNRGKNALALCTFFNIPVEASASISADMVTAAVLDSWDGTPEHGQLLMDLARCVGRYGAGRKMADR